MTAFKGPALLLIHWLMLCFGVSSGLYKAFGGAADVAIFATAGLSPWQVMIFGVVQAIAALATIPLRLRAPAASVLGVCNAFATVGLFLAGVRPFAEVSLIFVVMAIAIAFRHGASMFRA